MLSRNNNDQNIKPVNLPSLSVIIAVYNGAKFLEQSLPAICAEIDKDTEVILVNDGSTDNSAELGENFEVQVITLKTRQGSAKARNVGVDKARGQIILFIDADVVVSPGTIDKIRRFFYENTAIAAIFGSYDAFPLATDFFSQYRNLMHHYFHQTGDTEANTFWSGFGAVRRAVFVEAGGFDHKKFKIPSIEDIELGYRLRKYKHRIQLIPELQAQHLKQWTFYSILRTDFWQRAVPWAELMLLNPQIKHSLNIKNSQKVSAGLTGILLITLGLALWSGLFLPIAFFVLLSLVLINKEFYRFFIRQKGIWFALRVLPMHLFYFLYSSIAFAYSWLNVKILGRTILIR